LDALEQPPAVLGEGDLAVLAPPGGGDAAAALARHQLHAVAHGQDGQSQLDEALGQARCPRLADRARAAGEDHAGRLVLGQVAGGHVRADDHRVDAQLAQAAGDQARVLRAEVVDDDAAQLAVHSSCGGKTKVMALSSGTCSVTGGVSRRWKRPCTTQVPATSNVTARGTEVITVPGGLREPGGLCTTTSWTGGMFAGWTATSTRKFSPGVASRAPCPSRFRTAR